MKIKLQDYSLISNEWIENKILELSSQLCDNEDINSQINHSIVTLLFLKKQLLPSEKLAKACFENGTWLHNSNIDRELYFSSEIEIQ